MNFDIVIAGGGITGLATAYLAAKAGKKVAVAEAGSEFGGLLRTFETEGNKLEFYYHHFFTHDAEINWLVRDLGIEDKLFFKKTTMGVYRNGTIYDFNSPKDLLKFKPISFPDKVRFGLSSLYMGKMADWRKLEHVSAFDWLSRYAGKTSTESLWKPMLDIKFGPYAKQVPLAWMVGRMAQRLNSRKGGDERLGYINGSLQVLLDALLHKLQQMGVVLMPDTPIVKVLTEGNIFKGFETPSGTLFANKGLFTIPCAPVADLLQEILPETASALRKIEYFGAVCTILETDRQLSPIYWLNVADKGFPFGGIIEHTNFIPPAAYNGKHIVYLSRYFALNDPIANMSNQELATLMTEPLQRIYPNFDKNCIQKIHVFKTNTAATVCDLNFSHKVLPCKQDIEGLYIGNMMHIYPDERSTNNSIRVAAETGKIMGFDSSYVPYGASLSGKIGF